MKSSHRIALLESLADTIADYRQSEIPEITPAHVEKWLNQFDINDQPIILAEIDALMKRFYFSKARVKECLRTFVREEIVAKKHPLDALSYVRFLSVQKEGSSQEVMLRMVDEVLQEDYGCSIVQCGIGETDTFVYIDDGIYTGSRLRYDLTEGVSTPAWIPNSGLPNCRLMIYTIVSHVKGMNYAFQHINRAAKKKDMAVKMRWALIIDNRRKYGSKLEILWPEAISDDLYVDSYIRNLRVVLAQRNRSEQDLFRPKNVLYKDVLFSSPHARNIVEHAFVAKGARIVSASQNPAESVRPLGFEKIGSLGFGTLFVTYRNIANNCPLVLWWGDPDYPATHPLGMWYPLFPRRTNSQSELFVNGILSDIEPF